MIFDVYESDSVTGERGELLGSLTVANEKDGREAAKSKWGTLPHKRKDGRPTLRALALVKTETASAPSAEVVSSDELTKLRQQAAELAALKASQEQGEAQAKHDAQAKADELAKAKQAAELAKVRGEIDALKASKAAEREAAADAELAKAKAELEAMKAELAKGATGGTQGGAAS